MREKITLANGITLLRIPSSTALLFFEPFSAGFYIFYCIAGVSDMADGAVARKTRTATKFGARFDTVADFAFVAVCLLKLLPVLTLPLWLYIRIGAIALIKITNILSGFVLQRRLVALHTVMNKASGVLLFLLPLSLPFIDIKYSAVPLSAVATVAAIQEGHFIRSGREE